MKMPSRFISFFKNLIEGLATFVLGCLAMIMVLFYAKTSNPAINIAQVQSALAILDQVREIVLCLTAEVPHLNIYLCL
jgi:hypothetical protein